MIEPSITDWLQTGIAAVGFLGLCYYCWETHALRIAALVQGDAERRPFFDFELSSFADQQALLIAKNVGKGHALKVLVTAGNGDAISQVESGFAAALNVDVEIMRCNEEILHLRMLMYGGIRIDYEDIAGIAYWTTLTPARHREGGGIAGRYIANTGGGRKSLTLQQRIERWNKTLEG